MRINICLPGPSPSPMGGHRVAYEYADYLLGAGHAVTVIHALADDGAPARRVAFYAKEAARTRLDGKRLVPWANMSPQVGLRFVPYHAQRWWPSADVTLLTGWQTSERVTRGRRGGGLFQLVHDYELWVTAEPPLRRRIEASLRRHYIGHISASTAITGMLNTLGVPVVGSVAHGLAHDVFGVRRPVEQREPTVGFALRREAHKRMDVLIEALESVRVQLPHVAVQCFGVADRALPAWVERRGRVSDEALANFYNECAVFVVPSDAEGWGLPALEAMASGACLVTTSNGGSDDYAEDGVNASVVEPGRVDLLSKALVTLLSDEALRIRLARRGVITSQKYTLQAAGAQLERILCKGAQ